MHARLVRDLCHTPSPDASLTNKLLRKSARRLANGAMFDELLGLIGFSSFHIVYIAGPADHFSGDFPALDAGGPESYPMSIGT